MNAGFTMGRTPPSKVTGPLGDSQVDAFKLLAGALPSAGHSRNLACIHVVAATVHSGAMHRFLRTCRRK
mgnify:CR=1 FL=1